VPPDRGSDDHRGTGERESQAVSSVRGVKVAGGTPDPPHDAAEQVRRTEPERGEAMSDPGDNADQGPAS
jgi:hypothetical protein